MMIVGLLLMILGWMIQLYYSASLKIFALSLKFVVFFAVGCILLAIDGLQTGKTLVWILNFLMALISLMAGYFAKKSRPA